MHLRKWRKRGKDGTEEYWALVESYRTARGPRQRVVAYLGDMEEAARRGVLQAARGDETHQPRLFEEVAPEWVEVDTKRLRVERVRDFGGPWLGQQVLEKLGLDAFLHETLPAGREDISWAVMAQILVLGRLCDPCSELALAERVYARTALMDLLGVPEEKVNEDRLYRALDALLPHQEALEKHLKEKLGTLFSVEYDLLLYDITSTYFEGLAEGNSLAQRGYSRDHRPDCKQVCIALIVSTEGIPLAHRVFAGNRADVTTVEEIVEAIEKQYGAADRIWVMDRGMVSEEHVEFLKEKNRRYILGTPKSQLRRFEQHLVEEGWETVREGLEVKRCPSPEGEELFLLCRSRERQAKEEAMRARFEQRLEASLTKLAEACAARKLQPLKIERRVGRLLGKYTRAEKLFEVKVRTQEDGRAALSWKKREEVREWAGLSEGCYVLRTNITDWNGESLWRAYIQLTQAEAAFRIHKQDLSLRPVWHQKEDRVRAHILVCFLAYVLWKALGLFCQRAGLGDEPRQVFEELSQIRTVDVVLPTRGGPELRRRCVAQPTKHQAILLQKLRLTLPTHLKTHECSEKLS
jgi:transposase